MNQVLVVDDELSMRTAMEANFRQHGWNVTTAGGTEEALTKFRYQPCPLVITDMRMPDGDGLKVMQGVRSLVPDTAVIFLTAFGNIPEAVAAIKEGACDYLVKPISFEELKKAAQRILKRTTESGNDQVSHGLIGSSALMTSLVEKAKHVAKSETDVMLQAESGTGKELLARLIHRASRRRDRPMVAVNCAALPESLLESELFGHVRGAFTGATTSKPGRFEMAEGGTLLLDEIGEMPLSLQPKLLRVLQEREVDRLGDTRPLSVDVRVIATTHRSLGLLVDEGKFRADLYYRLNVVPLTIPALRERKEDIPELAAHFLKKYAPRSSGPTGLTLSQDLMDRLQDHDWPGNVRELENLIRRALTFSSGSVIGMESLEGDEFDARTSAKNSGLEAGLSLREMEKQLLERTLEATNGNRTHAAEMLGISLRTVRNKIREYELAPRSKV